MLKRFVRCPKRHRLQTHTEKLLDFLTTERETAIRNWLVPALKRELHRLGTSPRMEPEIGGDRNAVGSFVITPKYFLWAKLQPGAGTTKERVEACLLLHTFGYRGELAVRLSR